ncbi:MAG: hypothetical protein RLZZ433_908, partial [Pseudomonadota bacterium]
LERVAVTVVAMAAADLRVINMSRRHATPSNYEKNHLSSVVLPSISDHRQT